MAQRIGQRAHPLQDRDLGQHLVDEMGCGTGHAATAARRIEAVGKHAAVEVPERAPVYVIGPISGEKKAS